jgi:hypothetical protein
VRDKLGVSNPGITVEPRKTFLGRTTSYIVLVVVVSYSCVC